MLLLEMKTERFGSETRRQDVVLVSLHLKVFEVIPRLLAKPVQPLPARHLLEMAVVVCYIHLRQVSPFQEI